MDKPKDAKWYVFGAWHKIGEFDMIYIHCGSHWVLSSKTFKQLKKEMGKRYEY